MSTPVIAREPYMYFPDGMARTQLTWGTLERELRTRGTARNLNTVSKLVEKTEELEGSGQNRAQA